MLKEYYTGNPDTLHEYDDETNELLNSWNFSKEPGISFGWFQTSLNGGKEFVSEENTSHFKLTQEIGKKIIGKAIGSEAIDEDVIKSVGFGVNSQSAYKGRTFSIPKVITTWHKVTSEKLAEILDLLGGVDKFSDYHYVFPPDCDFDFNTYDGGSMKVLEYIESNDTKIVDADERNMRSNIKNSYYCPEWVCEIIEKYNTPNSKLADKTSKLGNMTIAQYNSLIRQEGKKPKITIKENNMKNNKYQKEFSNYINIMNEALKRNDFKAYDMVKNMLEESIDECKHEKELLDEMNTSNFGILNHIFEQQLPTLIKTNKKAVKNVIKTIKEDKNLLGQFNFYNAIKNQYKGNAAEIMESNDVLEKLSETVIKDIDQKTVKDSNKKLRKVMKENNIVPSEFVDDESKKLYESGHVILTKKRTTPNMITLMENYDTVCKYMEKHKDENVKKVKNIDEMIGDFEDKLKDNLNESEISFVKQITDFRSPIAEQRKEKLFNKFKNECVSKINQMLKEDSENESLKELGKQIDEMKFNNESIVSDIAKLLEIRDILMDD